MDILFSTDRMLLRSEKISASVDRTHCSISAQSAPIRILTSDPSGPPASNLHKSIRDGWLQQSPLPVAGQNPFHDRRLPRSHLSGYTPVNHTQQSILRQLAYIHPRIVVF